MLTPVHPPTSKTPNPKPKTGEFKSLGKDGKRFKLGDAMVWDVHGEGGEEGELLGKALMLKRIDVEELE
jgi:hypothetical protein